MKGIFALIVLAAAATCLATPVAIAADRASGTVKVGYTYLDEDGSLGVNQETFNLYEGIGLSLLDWRYGFDNGVAITGNLANITLNNRNLRAAVGKPGLFNLSVMNNQYRRVYDFEGNKFTRRRSTGVQLSVQPQRLVRLFGGFSVADKHGDNFEVLSPVSDTVVVSTDYTNTTYNVGTLVGNRRASLRLEYRHFRFDDKTSADADRKADNFSATATVLVPRHDWIVVSGGYIYRLDEAGAAPSKLQTDQVWGATKLYLPQNLVADYRLIYGIAQHTGPKQEADHIIHTASLARNWPRYGGLRVGYEFRIADDFSSKTNSSGFLANGWLKPADRWYVSAMLATRKSTVKEGVTLMGDGDYTRHQVTAKYADPAWGDISAQWQGRIRKNDDIDSRVDYNSLSTQLNLERKAYGRLTVVWSYYEGQYENRSDNIGFEFGDYVLSGTVHPRTWRNFDVDLGATYYRSRRSVDVEKSALSFGLMYTFLAGYHAEARYNVFNYDDYLVNDRYYTANIVEVNIIKDLAF